MFDSIQRVDFEATYRNYFTNISSSLSRVSFSKFALASGISPKQRMWHTIMRRLYVLKENKKESCVTLKTRQTTCDVLQLPFCAASDSPCKQVVTPLWLKYSVALFLEVRLEHSVHSIYIARYHKSQFALRSFTICTAYKTHRHSNEKKLKKTKQKKKIKKKTP